MRHIIRAMYRADFIGVCLMTHIQRDLDKFCAEGIAQPRPRFLDNVSLAALISPVGQAEFQNAYWEKKPLILHRNDPDYYGDLLALEDFDRAIANGPSYVKVADAKNQKKGRNEGGTNSGLERTLADMREGSTLVLDSLHNREPKLGLLCRQLEQELGHGFQTNIYLTPANGQGFTPHYDTHCVFVLQVMGSKHWKVEKVRRGFPSKDEHMGEEGREIGEDHQSFTLRSGDVLYIPRGYVHAGECGTEPSMHITLGVLPYTLENLLQAAVKAAARSDESLRRALPLGFMNADRSALLNDTIAALRKCSSKDFLSTVIEQYKDELVAKFPLDVSGQVKSFFEAAPVTNADRVGPRPGIVYRVHEDEDSIRVNVGGRSVTFPSFVRESLDFALKTKSYLVGELAGELEAEERPVFIERLMQEGLIVRK
jgi:ribosomal protein L16 Arg81 hydroxylase